MFSKLVCLIVLCSGVFGGLQLPPDIPKCVKTDPKLAECMDKSVRAALEYFKNGDKDFGFPRLEPLFIERLEIAADPGKSVQLSQKYDNVYMHGMIDAHVNKFKYTDDGKICKWEMEIYSPSTRMEADYALIGQVLVFPINGHGKCNVSMTGITNKHIAECEHYMKKGKSYMRLKNYSMDMTVKACHFDFPNIIPGNEQISRELGKTINENAVEIFQDVKGGFEVILAKLHENAANTIFSKLPEEEVFGQ